MKRLLHSLLLVLAIIATTTGVARSAEYSQPQVRLPLMSNAPAIDGQVNTEEWSGADRMERFGRPAPLSPQEASFWIGATEKELFIAVVSETPPGGKLLARTAPPPDESDAQNFLDDSVEIVLDPWRRGPAEKREIYHAIFNSRGAIYDMSYAAKGAQPWRGHWRIGTKVIGDRWHLELAVPWSDFDITEVAGRALGVRIGRNWQQSIEPVQTEWSPLGGAYLAPETMPLVTFDAAAPVVQTQQLQDPQKRTLHFQVTVFNPHQTPLAIKALLEADPADSPLARQEQTLSVAPGETKNVELDAPFIAPHEEIVSRILVTSSNGATVYYRRDWSWKLERPEIVWRVDKAERQKFGVRFAYYPSSNRMKVKVDLSGSEERAKVRAVNLAVRKKADPKSIVTTVMPALQKDATQLDGWQLPALEEGEYELVATLEGVQVAPQVLPFVRHRFEWEGNTLGKSDALIAPFTPIKVQGQTVGTILREHEMNGLGLWNQVTADGKKLLKAPMRLEVKIGGRVLPAQGQPLKFSEQKATRAVAQAQWVAGALNGSTQSEWDYDGLMKSTFTLQPGAQTIESLTLIIPLDNAQMPLLHTQTDGTRINYSGSTPDGTGRVWDGSKAARDEIIGDYVPYIWLGNAERGFSVSGENDKGWITDSKTPHQEIVRGEDGTLELRLNLISKPAKLDAARQIEIGFQATPVKPLPENWRLWTIWGWEPKWKTRVPGSFQQTFLASCWQWGALTPSDDIFPRNRDFRIYDQFAKTRRTGEYNKGFLEEWLKGYPAPFDENVAKYRNSLNSAFLQLQRKPQSVLPYTNARGVRLDTFEGQTFLDEWHREEFSRRDKKFGETTTYDMEPVASYRDYALYYYKKMLDTFADTIYFDDVFLQANFDTIGTQAYTLPDGRIQPSVGLWSMRELIRRTAILEHEMGKPNTIMAHTTNRQVAPMQAFAATQLSWENNAGDKPFQERFSRAYIQAESIGRQTGAVPFALGLVNGSDPAKLDFARRSGSGVLLTHEIKTIDNWSDYWQGYDRLLQFGYGTPQARVFNYWQQNYPAQISGGETSSLLLSKPGSALIVVCDYGKGGDFKLQLDAAKLGLTGKLTATDMETGTLLETNSKNEILFPLAQYDFKMILVSANP
jgi:hypothetical protein